MRTNEEMFAELDAFIESVGNSPSEMIAILHTAQGIFGYLPMKVQKHIADRIGVILLHHRQSDTCFGKGRNNL